MASGSGTHTAPAGRRGLHARRRCRSSQLPHLLLQNIIRLHNINGRQRWVLLFDIISSWLSISGRRSSGSSRGCAARRCIACAALLCRRRLLLLLLLLGRPLPQPLHQVTHGLVLWGWPLLLLFACPLLLLCNGFQQRKFILTLHALLLRSTRLPLQGQGSANMYGQGG